MDFTVLAEGSHSDCSDHVSVVIRNQEELEELWAKYNPRTNKPVPIPVLDFEKEMLIACFRGMFPITAYSTKILGVEEAQDIFHRFLIVNVEERDPRPTAVIGEWYTWPFCIIKLGSQSPDRAVHFRYIHRVGWGRLNAVIRRLLPRRREVLIDSQDVTE